MEAVCRLEGIRKLHGPAQLPGFRCVLRSVDWRERHFPGAIPPPVAPISLIFVNSCGIGQHELQEVSGRLRAPDGPGEPTRHQLGEHPAVIDMRMRQDHSVNLARIERKIFKIECFERA